MADLKEQFEETRLLPEQSEQLELEFAPAVLAGKAAPEPEIVRWVARNIDAPDASSEACPDPFAWTLLRECRTNPEFRFFFIEKLWAKLLPSRAQQEDGSGKVNDGQPTLDLIERILAMRDGIHRGDRATAAHRAHNPKLAGSTPASANSGAFNDWDPGDEEQ